MREVVGSSPTATINRASLSMARTITASVGRLGGVNRPPDVITVQELLNKVRPGSGGPSPPLVVDGICGPKTIHAIQVFQLHHFGWQGADGRVDPGGPTLAKLNEFDVPPGTHGLRIRRVGFPGTFLDPKRPEDWFFEVSDPLEAGVRSVYHLRSFFERPPLSVPLAFAGEIVEFTTTRGVADLETRGAGYRTVYDVTTHTDDPGPPVRARPRFSGLDLAFLAEPGARGDEILRREGIIHLNIGYPAHIDPPLMADLDKQFPPPAVSTVRSKGDQFVRVR